MSDGARSVDRMNSDSDGSRPEEPWIETTRASADESVKQVHTAHDQLDFLLEDALEAYLEAAPLESPSQLRQFLPECDLETRRFLLVELIKLDMASLAESLTQGVHSQAFHAIEDYLVHFRDVMTADEVPLDLIMEEIQLRKEADEVLDAAAYARRFPQHASMVAELLGGQLSAHPEATAAVSKRKRPPEFSVGEQIDDFVIVQTLGSGAFANVYLARQVSMSRLVALKVSKGTGDEPQALAQFDHPNIVRVFDQRLLTDPPVHLLYMQFHPGGTLADVVQAVRNTRPAERGGALMLRAIDHALLNTAQVVPERSSVREELRAMSWPMAVAWMGIQLARALENAHRRGVMHRDVKPANVLLSAEGVPKLADFNVSFAGSAGRAGAANSFGGSIGYMAPEHLRAISATALTQPEEVGPHADLYSLAILLWELWQGKRPFEARHSPQSWTDAVEGQLHARAEIQPPENPENDALSRLLEKILREALSFEPVDRMGSGAEFEARLLLAMHPQAARLFDPEPGSRHDWVSRRSPWLVTAMIILVPNLIAGAFGLYYNAKVTLGGLESHLEQIGQPAERFETIQSFFYTLSNCINSVAFPLAVLLVVIYTWRVIQGLKSVEQGNLASDNDLFATFQLAHRAAVIGGFLWCLAAVLYPAILSTVFPEFSRREIGHFFLSHVICGGIAAIYPFFGISAYAITVLYPKLVRRSLKDPGFDQRVIRLVRRSERYLLLACAVPLLGATLLLVSAEDAKGVVLVAIGATGLGLFAAFSAYRFIVRQCRLLSPVLSQRKDSLLGL